MSFDQIEIKAIEAMLPDMGSYVADKQIGEKTFNQLSRDEVLGLFANTIRAFRVRFDEECDGIPF